MARNVSSICEYFGGSALQGRSRVGISTLVPVSMSTSSDALA
jgi:hypothetical protein